MSKKVEEYAPAQQALIPKEPFQPGEWHPVPAQPPMSMLEMIGQLSVNPQANIEVLSLLLVAKEKQDTKEAEMAFNAAMARLQPKLPRITKDGKIKLSGSSVIPFATFEHIDAAIRPLLSDEGLSVSFTSEPCDKGVLMGCTIAHTLGHSITSKMQLPPDAGPARNALQAIGSARSYAKRYLLSDMLNLVTEGQDNDGNSYGFVDDEELAKIAKLYDLLPEDEQKRFLKVYMKCDSTGQIFKRDFNKAMTALANKLRQMQAQKGK